MTYRDLVKPSFEINFWFKHFRGFDEDTSRAYEAFLMAPVGDSMFFADTIEWYDEDCIDCTDIIDSLYDRKNKDSDSIIYLEGFDIDYIKNDNEEFCDENEEETE